MMNSRRFTVGMILLGIIFVAGTFWVWRSSFVDVELSNIENIPLVQRSDIAASTVVDRKIESEDNESNKEPSNLPIPIKAEELIQAIPSQINLDVPFTSQAPEKNWDQPWQDACEEAAVLMLDAYYKDYGLSPVFARDEILKMVEWEEDEKHWGRSIDIEKVNKLASWQVGKSLGDFSIIENPTIEQIKRSVAAGHPVLVVADGKALPNPYFRNGGPEYHALIIRGYTEEKFITNDPGTKRGENFTYYYDDLMNAIHDWNDGDVKNGGAVVLMIE